MGCLLIGSRLPADGAKPATWIKAISVPLTIVQAAERPARLLSTENIDKSMNQGRHGHGP
jgi:hypothetical protein